MLVREASRARAFRVAASHEWHGFSDASAVIDVAGRYRLGTARGDLGTAVGGVTFEILSTTFFARAWIRMCAFMRYSAHGGDCAPRSECASCRGTARTGPDATRAVGFRRRQAHHHTRAVTLARAGNRTSETTAGEAAPHAVWAEVGEAGGADRAVGVATGGVGIQPQRKRVHAARSGFGPRWFDCQCSETHPPRPSPSSPPATPPPSSQTTPTPPLP